MSDAERPGSATAGGPAKAPSDAAAAGTTSTRDRVLLVVFWAWAGVLVVATLAHLFGWQGVLDVLDVKRWFGGA